MQKLSMDALNRKSLEEFRRAGKIPVIAVLENIRSAYNVGSVFRTADAFLISEVILTGYTAHPPHKEIRKTALGAEESVKWTHFREMKEALHHLRSMNFTIYAVEQATGSLSLEKSDFGEDDRIAVVFGNEVTGVENETLLACDGCIEIPQLGMKHSLNIATAAGVVLWELVRNRLRSFQKQ